MRTDLIAFSPSARVERDSIWNGIVKSQDIRSPVQTASLSSIYFWISNVLRIFSTEFKIFSIQSTLFLFLLRLFYSFEVFFIKAAKKEWKYMVRAPYDFHFTTFIFNFWELKKKWNRLTDVCKFWRYGNLFDNERFDPGYWNTTQNCKFSVEFEFNI